MTSNMRNIVWPRVTARIICIKSQWKSDSDVTKMKLLSFFHDTGDDCLPKLKFPTEGMRSLKSISNIHEEEIDP